MPRQGIPDTQRKALRDWYQNQYPRPRQKTCIAWFLEKFNHKLSQSTVSECLSDHFSYLDTPNPSLKPSFRQRAPQWPILEDILFDWQQIVEKRGVLVTGDIIVEKAKEIWPQIPEYQGLPPPEFSQGWLHKFKKRHNIQHHTNHGEALSVPSTAFEEMKAVQTLCGEYQERDIYNMDETGLCWRNALSSGLATQSRPGVKKDKSRITLVVCTNCTGTDRLPLWIFGTAQRPHSLRGLNIEAIGGYWRANKKAWMTGIIMKEWLLKFYEHVGSRTVLLLMDNFPAHTQGVQLTPPENIRIQWLPTNSTSLFQPLDQGINRNLKSLYRKKWLQFILQKIEESAEPYSLISLHHTVHWIIHAWLYEVSNTTIYNCFRKSKVIQPQTQHLPIEPAPDLQPLYNEISHSGQIRNMMSLENFLNPEDEDLINMDSGENGDPLTALIEHYTQKNTDLGEPAMEEDTEEVGPPPVPSIEQALEGLQVFIDYEEHQEDTCRKDIQALEQWKQRLMWKHVNTLRQATLDQWFR